MKVERDYPFHLGVSAKELMSIYRGLEILVEAKIAKPDDKQHQQYAENLLSVLDDEFEDPKNGGFRSRDGRRSRFRTDNRKEYHD